VQNLLVGVEIQEGQNIEIAVEKGTTCDPELIADNLCLLYFTNFSICSIIKTTSPA
jgi:hypothetical protein